MIIEAIKQYAQGHIAKHKANIHVYLNNPVGIGEHSDVLEAIEIELDKMARYQDQLDMLEKHFKND